MLIREEKAGDYSAIAQVTARAFADVKHSSQTEAQIIEKLRLSGTLTISLVAIDAADLVGHVAISPVTINGAHARWFGLGPVSVSPDHQGIGIGRTLVRAAIERLRLLGAAGCVVLGEPSYYARFGFERDESLRYKGAPAEYFMRLPLIPTEQPTGFVEYASAFTE